MYSKSLLIYLVVCFLSDLSHGQGNNNLIWRDYNYIEEVKGFYKIHTTPQTWSKAKQVCAQEGASLFYAENDKEAHAVVSFWKRTQPDIGGIHMGISDLKVKTQFETIDGKLASEVYNNWRTGEPSNNDDWPEHCVAMYRDETMNNIPCSLASEFVCKKSLQSIDAEISKCSMSARDYLFNKDSGNCYKLHTTPLNWTEAYAVCSAEQSYLAVINNHLEADYLAHLTQSVATPSVRGFYLRGLYHLGFHNRFSEGWQTVKGTPLNADADAWWGNYQPVGNEQCGSMFFNGRLNNIECDTRSFFICEHEIDSLNLSEERRQ